MSVLGFVFWSICTRLYTTDEIGTSTAILAALNLVTSLSLLGFEISIIRLLPGHERKSALFNTCVTIAFVCGILFSSGFILLQPLISHNLGIIQSNPGIAALFILFTLVSIGSYMVESAFIAYTQSKYVLHKNIIFSILKLPLPFALIFLGAFGIYSAWMVSLLVAVAYSFWRLQRTFGHRLRPQFAVRDLKGSMRYSLFNYIAAFIEGAPIMVIPLLITSLMGATTNAYYYVAMMVANVLFMIPISATQSLFAEGSQTKVDTRAALKRAAKFMAALLIPGVIGAVLIGPYALHIFGEEYAQYSAWPLALFAVSAIPMAFTTVCRTLLKLQFRSGLIVALDFIGAGLIISFCYLFADQGLNGVALAWLCGQTLLVAVFGYALWRVRARS
jgi:O-antigen/teichoic acid export membrane protein